MPWSNLVRVTTYVAPIMCGPYKLFFILLLEENGIQKTNNNTFYRVYIVHVFSDQMLGL